MKPIFNKLVDIAIGKPCDTTLEKLLAFKKSLMSFETRSIRFEKYPITFGFVSWSILEVIYLFHFHISSLEKV